MNFNKINISAILIFLCFKGLAQQATTSTGGDAFGSGGSVSYSVGQIVYTTNTGLSGSLSQGVQQPYEIFTVGMKDEMATAISLLVFPNPTTNFLTLQADDLNNKKLSYQVFDVHGRLLESFAILSNQTQINMGSYLAGTYFIHVSCENNIVESFKVIKN